MAEVPWADHVGLFKLLGNLKRICCTTAYLHVFSQEVLRRLEDALTQRAAALEVRVALLGGVLWDERVVMNDLTPNRAMQDSVGGSGEAMAAKAQREQQSVIAARRKYRRIREELEKVRREPGHCGVVNSHVYIFCPQPLYSIYTQASWEAASGPQERGRARFVHTLSAWQRETAADTSSSSSGTPLDPAAEERRRRLVATLLEAFCERGLSDRALETLQAFYVDEVSQPGG